jgi:O-methyltransferase
MTAPLFIRVLGRPLTKACIRYLQWRGYTKIPERCAIEPPKRAANGEAHQIEERYFYDEGDLATPINHDFLDDSKFREVLAISRSSPFASRGYYHGRWNLHVSLWAASHALALGADIVQLGVFEGSEASAIVTYTDFAKHPWRIFLVDTFTGVPEGLWTEEELKAGAAQAQWAYKELGDVYEYVRNRFNPWPNVTVIQGRVPEVLPSVTTNRIGLLMLDLNVAAPERAAAEFFWDRIVPGGIILSDDYGHSRKGVGYYGQKLAFDEFARSKGLSVLTIPTGHGLIIKPRA